MAFLSTASGARLYMEQPVSPHNSLGIKVFESYQARWNTIRGTAVRQSFLLEDGSIKEVAVSLASIARYIFCRNIIFEKNSVPLLKNATAANRFMICAGGLHLVGESGLLSRLRARHYDIIKI